MHSDYISLVRDTTVKLNGKIRGEERSSEDPFANLNLNAKIFDSFLFHLAHVFLLHPYDMTFFSLHIDDYLLYFVLRIHN